MTGFQINKPAVATGRKDHQATVKEELTAVVYIMMRKMICTARENLRIIQKLPHLVFHLSLLNRRKLYIVNTINYLYE